MNLKDIVGQLPLGKSSPESNLVSNVVFVMKEFGYTVEEMRNMPLPSFITVLEVLQKENERQEREMKKTRRK